MLEQKAEKNGGEGDKVPTLLQSQPSLFNFSCAFHNETTFSSGSGNIFPQKDIMLSRKFIFMNSEIYVGSLMRKKGTVGVKLKYVKRKE